MKINFTKTGWEDYLYWEGQDKKTLKQINRLIADIERNGYDGIGKPEPPPRQQTVGEASCLCGVVEMTGIEPVSENPSARLSTGVDCL